MKRTASIVAVGAATIALAAAALMAGTGAAQAARQRALTPWYWTAGWCKNILQEYGMQLYDGRTFNVGKAFCVGRGGLATCQWSSNYRTRLYTKFLAFTRSYDGVVRMFDLYPTGREAYRAYNIRAVGREQNPYKFSGYVGMLAREYAAGENQKGCARYQP